MKEEKPEITNLSVGGSRGEDGGASSISGLILGLKTLQNVVLEELQAKEVKSKTEIEDLKKEVEDLKKQKELAESKAGFLRFAMTEEKDVIEEKLKKEIKAIEQELDECKLDKEDLYGEIHALEEDRKACENRAKKAEEKYEELQKDADKINQKDKDIILENRRKIDELERVKRDMEKKVEDYERKFEELKNHVLLLEESVYKMILNDGGDEEDTPVSGNAGFNMGQSGSSGWDMENNGVDNRNDSVDEADRIESEEENGTEGNDLVQVPAGSSSTRSSNKRKRDVQSSDVRNVGYTSAILILDSDDEEISQELGEKNRSKVPKRERTSLLHVCEDEMETDIGTTEVKQVNFDIKPNDSPVNQSSPCNDVNKLNMPSSRDPTISREGEDKIGVLQKSLNYFSKLPIGMVGDTDAEDSSSSSESEEYMGITFDLEGFKAKRQMDGVKKTGHLKLT